MSTLSTFGLATLGRLPAHSIRHNPPHDLSAIRGQAVCDSKVPEGPLDYLRYYDLESYLFEDVSSRLHAEGSLSAFDFFSIVIWKANRAKTHMAARLLKQGHPTLEHACRALTSAIHQAPDERSRFMVLVKEWGFRLPMASAVLSVIYPEQFTVYDYRACDVIGDFRHLTNRVNPDSMWEGYVAFREGVRSTAPAHLSLRDQDRYLWGRAVAEQLKGDIKNGFGVSETSRT